MLTFLCILYLLFIYFIFDSKKILNDIVGNTTITQSALSMLLNGKRKISLLQIIEIADYLNCSIDYLLYRSFKNK
ncbi:MAG: helix-turn-helix domain-containing protein [Thomasclavelia ramosa]